jgi:RND superfamily putative drug exporter
MVGHEIQMKEFGFGLIASIALDATLIRVVLVPSIMELMGNANWWLPGFLQRFAQTADPFGEGSVEAIDEDSEELESVTA